MYFDKLHKDVSAQREDCIKLCIPPSKEDGNKPAFFVAGYVTLI